MKSRWIINLLLLVAIVILGLVARFEPGIEAPPVSAAITPLKLDQVHRIHINRPIRDDIVLVRQSPEHWLVERSTALPADNLKVRALARLAEQVPVRSYAATDMDLDALQLDPPYATAVLNDIAIEFGNLEPIDDLRYIRIGDQVHLIPDKHLQLMEAGFSQFVRQRLFAGNTRITSISLPAFSLTRSGETWEASPATGIDNATMQQFIDRWQDAAALYVQTASPEQQGEAITVTLGDNSVIRFLLVASDPELMLVRPDYGILYRMADTGEALLSLETAAAEPGD